MAWYAKIKDNTVVEVTYLVDDLTSEWLYREYGGKWLRCTEDGSLRKIFPAKGYGYDPELDCFVEPQPIVVTKV